MAKKTKSSIRIVHRINRSQHRIEVYKDGETPSEGVWAGHRDIARHGALAATTDHYTGVLPSLFRISEVEHNTLTE